MTQEHIAAFCKSRGRRIGIGAPGELVGKDLQLIEEVLPPKVRTEKVKAAWLKLREVIDWSERL